MNKKAKKLLLENSDISVDKIVCHRDGSLSCRLYYFYTHGRTAEKFAQKIKTFLTENGFNVTVESEDRWNAWPKDSYFLAKISFDA